MGKVINNKLKLLITGANGQLGRCIQDVTGTYPNYDFHFKTSKELDVTSKEQVDILFALEKFDYCINCAAYTAVDKAETDQENAFLVNAKGVKYLAEACKAQDSILIHISTDFVFDGSKTTPYAEDDVPNPINVYGASKLKGEQYVQQLLNKYFIIRTSWVYSEYGNNFVKTMLRLGSERAELNVVNDQIGTPTYAGDLAAFLLAIIGLESKKFGIYNYSNDGEISWHEFAATIFEACNLPCDLSPITSMNYKTIAERPRYTALDKSKSIKSFKTDIVNWKHRIKQLLVKINNPQYGI